MNTKSMTAVLTTVAVLAGAVCGPLAAHAQDGRQKDKNNMRNIGIGLGAVAAHQALKGKGTNALVLGAGAVYAGKKYEDGRKAQNRENSGRRYGYRYKNGKRVGYRMHSRHAR